MAKFEDFVKEWYITDWQIAGSGPIPRGGFARGSLSITAPIATSPGVSKVADLAWKNEGGQECLLKAISFREVDGTLHDPRILVYFGGVPQPITVAVTLSITETGVLKGHLQHTPSGPPLDGNTGTFAADADPPRDDRRDGKARGRSGKMAPRQKGEHERIRGAASGA